jgi:hypothetical protein
MSKKLPYDLTEEEIAELLKRKKEINDYAMKEFKKDEMLSSGDPHVFKMTLDDGWSTYQYDINLTENWCLHDIRNEFEKVLKRYGCSIGVGELCDSGYLENK